MSTADAIARILADYERRLVALERADQLEKSSVQVNGEKIPVAAGIAAGYTAGTVSAEALAAAQDAYTAAHNIGPDQLAENAVVFGKIAVGAVGAQAIRADALIGQLIATAPSGARVELKPADATNTVFFYTGRADEVYPGGITAFNANGGLSITAAGIGVATPGEATPAARFDIGVDPTDATRRLVEFTWAHGFNVLADEDILLQGAGTGGAGNGGHISIGKPRGTNTYVRGVHISGNITLDPNFSAAPGFGGDNKVTVKGDLVTDTVTFAGGGRKTTATNRGRASISTNASGQVTVAHGLGGAPDAVLPKLEGSFAYDVVASNYTDTTFTVTVIARSTGAAVGAGIAPVLVWAAWR